MPSPDMNQPGLLLRDPWRYTEKVIFVPPPWTVRTHGDDLKWRGYSPLYTFTSALPAARGSILGYEQWNIDPQSVVSFASLEFSVP